MQRLYEEYKDVVEFRLVYIHEAHANSEFFPEPQTKQQRSKLADLLCTSCRISIPVLIDEMDNRVAGAYYAFPERAYLIGRDGKIVYCSMPGPDFTLPENLGRALQKFTASGT